MRWCTAAECRVGFEKAELDAHSGLLARTDTLSALERGDDETRFVIECARTPLLGFGIGLDELHEGNLDGWNDGVSCFSLGVRALPESSDSDVLLRGDSVRAVGEFAGFVELPESAESRRIFSSSTRDCLDSLSSEHGRRGLKLSLSDCYFSTELEKLCSVKACFRSDYLDNVQPNHMN